MKLKCLVSAWTLAWIISPIFLMSSHAVASLESSDRAVPQIQLTAFSLGKVMALPLVASAYDNVPRYIGDFYRSRKRTLQMGAIWLKGPNTKVGLHYDGGYLADKYAQAASLSLLYGQTHWLKRSQAYALYMNYEISAKLGGKESHTPCSDSLGRRYFCANLTAWSDFVQSEQRYGGRYQGAFRLTYKY